MRKESKITLKKLLTQNQPHDKMFKSLLNDTNNKTILRQCSRNTTSSYSIERDRVEGREKNLKKLLTQNQPHDIMFKSLLKQRATQKRNI
ncbi:hypothetical protein N780_09610 [Pontibacillus chungwhensis BH030062]|uniref:Uncharacterized protein n=1 Tax=Pontibacillus chungwhensis BH030062 TaxID=1385513 RepID=A0A0A2UTW9_9BACI|nr:hypothetical protein N780_09610 [Pontibacillus chungwhensis BH030062]